MIRVYYAERDATLYEQFETQNTGIDQILEIAKIASGSKLNGVIQQNQYLTRFLIDFGSQITAISQSIYNGEMPAIADHAKSALVHIELKAADASDLLHSYTVETYAVSQSWQNGNGNYSDDPIVTNGVSWKYRTGKVNNLRTWNVDDANASTSHTQPLTLNTNYTVADGGGTWITGSTEFPYGTRKTFKNESPDIRLDIGEVVNRWISGSFDNNGLIFKFSDEDENSDEILGSIKFFGRESHTIFVPKLLVSWNDTEFTATPGADEIGSDTYVPYFKNIKDEYRSADIAKFRLGVRPEFPNKAFQTSSFYLTGERLPTSSYYSILDSITNETIIPFDTQSTQIDCDANGNFFKLRMDSFFPERFYKIMLKIERSGSTDVQTFDDFYFKVVN